MKIRYNKGVSGDMEWEGTMEKGKEQTKMGGEEGKEEGEKGVKREAVIAI